MIAPLPRSALKGAAPFAARLAAAPPPPALKPASDSAGAPSVTKDDVLTQLSYQKTKIITTQYYLF